MSRRFQRKNHNGKWTANRVDRGLRFRERSTPIRDGILAAASEIAKDNASEREIQKPKESLDQKPEWKPPAIVSTIDQAIDVLNHISMDGFICPMSVEIDNYYVSSGHVTGATVLWFRIRSTVNERDTGFPIQLYTEGNVNLPATIDEFISSIKERMVAQMTHEIEEQIKLNGKRFYNPHPYGI